MDESGLRLVLEALEYAAEQHRDQRRKDPEGTPYINHPIRVMNILFQTGEWDPGLLAAALLHDTVEDTSATDAELRERFGDDVADLVAEVTDDKSLDKAERKRQQVVRAPKKTDRAKRLKLADKICNLTDILDSPPSNWTDHRRRAYFDWAEEVAAGLRDADPSMASRLDALCTRGRARYPRTS